VVPGNPFSLRPASAVSATRTRKPARGFTLPEALLSLLVMSITVVVLATYPHYALQVKHGRHLEQANQLAHQELEARRQAGYSALPTVANASQSATSSTMLTSLSALPNATGTVTVTRVNSSMTPSTVASGGSDTNRRRVDVTISWTGQSFDSGSQTITTLISN